MIEFTISIAGIPIGIHALYESTKDYCTGYFTDEKPEFTIISSRKIIQREQKLSDQQASAEGKKIEKHSEYNLEKIGIYREIAELLLDKDILLFHGSAIAVDGEAYIFTAKSGTGKSTHTRLWRQMLGDRAMMVNDDKPMIKITSKNCFACGTPWTGKLRRGSNVVLPLKAICILERAEKNRIQPISAWDAQPVFVQQSYHPLDQSKNPKMLELLNSIMEYTALYRMECNNMKPDAAQVSFKGMNNV